MFIGVTVPLITNDNGEKLGKSLGNALWLDENLSTPYECYQVSWIYLMIVILF
jgi:tyrosyl-tRNA synthetase